MKNITNISFSEIDGIPLLIKDFLSKKLEELSPQLFSLANFERQIVAKKNSFSTEQRTLLQNVLTQQMADCTLSSLQLEHLKSISSENTFTVTTGHQLNLFTGPVFFIYKILQTIKTAKYLEEHFPDCKFVPIFWLASEDHDFEEINHFKTKNNFYEIRGKSGGAVGKIKVEETAFISEFEKEFQDSIYGTELIQLLKKAYQKGKTLTEATKTIVQYLFAEQGLLYIDGDDAQLKAEMNSIFKDELLNQSLKKTTTKMVDFLTQKYGKVQVNPREINLFYLSETRNRIDFDGKNYQIHEKNKQFSENEILAELEKNPEKFSPNALMRPVFQEKILPNLAYIGGNAEIMYWFELKSYFEKWNIPFPILIPRNSMLFLSEKTTKKIEKLGLELDDFLKDFAHIINKKLLISHELTPILQQKEAELRSIFSLLKEKSSLTDKTFRNLVEAEESRQLKSYQRMNKRLLRAEKNKNQNTINQLELLFTEVHPAKIWQERVYNFSVFFSDFGQGWLQYCYSKIIVDNSELIISEF